MRRQAGFFDVADRLKWLSDLGDQIEAFEAAVEFEAFRPELNAALPNSDGMQGGRPPFDPVMMFSHRLSGTWYSFCRIMFSRCLVLHFF